MKYKIKIDACDYHKMTYVAHLIGQVQECDISVQTKHVASWLNVSKPTAMKYLNFMVDAGLVVRTEKTWRKNAVSYSWHLSDKAWRKFQNGNYLGWYRHYKTLVLQILEMKGNATLPI